MLSQRVSNPRFDMHALVETALSRSAHLSGKNLRIEIHEEEIVIRGVVRSYYQKQLAQESVKSIEGVGRIMNEIEVVAL